MNGHRYSRTILSRPKPQMVIPVMTIKRTVTIILLMSLQTSLYSGASGTCIHRQSVSDKHSHINSANVPANQSLVVPENVHPQSASDRRDQLSNNSENDNGSSTIPGPVVETSDSTTMPDTEIACAATDVEQKISVKMFL